MEGELKIFSRIKSFDNFTLIKQSVLPILSTIRGIKANVEKLPIKCGGKASSGLQKGHSYVSSAHFSASASF